MKIKKRKQLKKAKEEIKEPTPEKKLAELEDKVARTFAEMENQRRRFEKKKKKHLSMEVIVLLRKH